MTTPNAVVLVLRVRALYRGNRTVTWILGVGFVLAMLGSAAIVGTALEQSPRMYQSACLSRSP